MSLEERLAAARGDIPARLVLRNAQLINVMTGEIYPTDIAIHGTYVVGVGDGYDAEEEIDLQGRYVCPGFIDAHVHIESSLCTPKQFARAVLPHGVTAVIADPHEIANVLGLTGIRYMLDEAKHGMMSIFVTASSCVPATRMETSGAQLEAPELELLVNNEWVVGLAEVMNYPGVINAAPDMLAKIALYRHKAIDGHSPQLKGRALNAYITAGIHSEHESTTVEEALEKLRKGMTIFVREGTTTRDLRALLPMITQENHTHICFCTDDRVPASLIDEGSIDHMIRVAISKGIDPIMAIRMGTINTARHFHLREHGVIAPGKRADLVVFSDLKDLRAEMVMRGGKMVAKDGAMIAANEAHQRYELPMSVNVHPDAVDFSIPAQDGQIHIIGTIEDQIVTEDILEDPHIVDGYAVADTTRDILKIAVIERHQATGNIGKGFIRGFGLQRGALAGTVAHDHHNLIVLGTDDISMQTAARAVIDMDGGLAIVDGDAVLGTLPLPVAGLMSDQLIEDVREQYDRLTAIAHDLGCTMGDPFMAMSFMGLEVIPSLKLTDLGLVDVENFCILENGPFHTT